MAKLQQYKNHVIVCGYGLVGERIVEILSEHKVKVLVIEPNPKKAEVCKEAGIRVLVGDATSTKTLKEAGVLNARAIAVVMDDDAKNLFCVITAKGLNKNIIIATRANDELIKDKFRDAGADFIAAPNKSTSDELFREIIK